MAELGILGGTFNPPHIGHLVMVQEAILELARLAVAEREDLRREQIAERLDPLHPGDRVVFFDMPRLDLSSSGIRARVAGGRPIRYIVPGPVAEAIRARRLYPPAAGRPA